MKRTKIRLATTAVIGFALVAANATHAQSLSRLFSDNFESENLSKWSKIGNKSSRVIELQSGNAIAFMHLNPSVDPDDRSAIVPKSSSSNLKPNNYYNIEFRMNPIRLSASPGKDALVQITPRFLVAATEGTVTPQQAPPDDGPISIFAQNGRLKLKALGKTVDAGAYSEKRWSNFALSVCLSRGKQGFVELFRNNALAAAINGPNISDASPHSLEIGVCRQFDGKPVPTREIYFDNVNITN